jgi:hypothetical protein
LSNAGRVVDGGDALLEGVYMSTDIYIFFKKTVMACGKQKGINLWNFSTCRQLWHRSDWLRYPAEIF